MLASRTVVLPALALFLALGAAGKEQRRDGLSTRSRHANIIRNIRSSFPRKLYARASNTPCSTVRNTKGECCPVDALTTNGEDCCPAEDFYNSCGGNDCCDDGVLFSGNTILEVDCCRSPSVLYYPNGGSSSQNAACCDTGVATTTDCCEADQIVVDNTCTGSARLVRRNSGESKSYMIKRQDSGRYLLSPDLIAEHLMSNGMFKHDGQFFIDHHHQKSNEGRLRTLAAKGVSKALKWVAKPGTLHDAAAWNSVDFVPISAAYEFAVSDVPEIYARIVAKDDFTSFNWKGVAFDRDVLYGLASGHPAFNASLVDFYK